MNPLPQMKERLRQQEEEAKKFLASARVYLTALTRRIMDWDPKVEKYQHFDGPCPFLTCLETGPHDHPICPDCGALRWGNLYCPTCRSHWPKALQPFCSILETMEEKR